ncbi:2d2d636a-4081-40f4-95d7-1eea880a8be8 [Sclerotinia trifoliorum]|uniref:2d2d636a-4081-40f4-95d7-1eea880a8be8 n=1 Tax=Sclerotinia trifoliorum TaxID=28548 RepID=A0A8H2VPT5_9HELO|nr:2d2d636a-4081-40f4-95d7-1eea880a8be8 [Sclerotinia trifoliorum]
MMASRRGIQIQPEFGYGRPTPTTLPDSSRRSTYTIANRPSFDSAFYPNTSASYAPDLSASPYNPITAPMTSSPLARLDSVYGSNAYSVGSSSNVHRAAGPSYGPYTSPGPSWVPHGRISPETYMDDYAASPSPTDYTLDPAPRTSGKARSDGKGHSQRRPSNRDEFDGPHQFLQRPPPEYIAQQERDLPHLPTNLVVQEQDSVLTRVNDRLSQCAFDFVAKYQFPIPLNDSCRPVERPQDREWTEWVYLLKRLATKRRIPARVLYNGQIKQFVTILENSLEMRHAAKHQSRPLKDDRNILQLISAGIQVAKILKDAEAMSYLDRLYVTTEQQIQERSASRFRP